MVDSPWSPTSEPASLMAGGSNVTLVEGRCFCLSASSGDIQKGRPEGLFLLDSRLISRLELSIGGEPPEPLSVALESPSEGIFTARARPAPGLADSTLLVIRSRYVGQGMREDIELRSYSQETVNTTVRLDIESDFVDLFAVKDGRASHAHEGRLHRGDLDIVDNRLVFTRHRPNLVAQVSVNFQKQPSGWSGYDIQAFPSTTEQLSGSEMISSWNTSKGRDPVGSGSNFLEWEVQLNPGETWTNCFEFGLSVAGEAIEPRYRCGEKISHSPSVASLKKWRQEAPVLSCDFYPLESAVKQAVDDIGSLRIFDPDHPDEPVIAAGAPWFMTLFGRDSLISAWMSLTIDPDLALGVLDSLARLQGTRVNPKTEEQPGRILHEVRFDRSLSPSLADSSIYYGSIDSTPLFVMLLGELRRWGLAKDDVDRLIPAADRALKWITDYGDVDGDGYVEYKRSDPEGLANQGWKDSWDSISFRSGELAQAPIALAEVQGYVYAAYRARAYFAREAGDSETDSTYTRLADDLKVAFNRDFWLPSERYFAIGLDASKKPIDSLASNMGHCLLTGILEADKARDVVEHLMSPEMFSGWGIRTLATTMARFNPISYHNGSIWPHDNAMIAAGMMRYGFVEQAHRVILALLDVAEHYGGRLPELFGGLDRSEMNVPLAYPTSCSPQAWAAASPLLMLRTLLRLDPWIPFAKLWLSPSLPNPITRMKVEGIPMGSQRITISCATGQDAQVDGITPGIEVISEPRPPLGGGQIEIPKNP